jgi:hypothetical protein
MFHIFLHIVLPLAPALLFFRKQWMKAYAVMISTLIIDADHLLADPVYDPNRCSLGFHPLHSLAAIGVYILFLMFPKTRAAGAGLCLHMILDGIDCLFM